MNGDDLKRALVAEAQALGFADIGVTTPDGIGGAGERLHAWIAQAQHGDMTWMEGERLAWRADPRVLWPEAQSIIMLADAYTPEGDPLDALADRDRAAISVYAQGRDYHDVVKKRLKRLGRWLIDRAGGEIKVFVDTAPVMEKPLAEAAGLGWQGKHTNLVSRRLGSWFFLGAIFTTVPLPADHRHEDRCGACRRCLDICPTAAFPGPYRLDARRCISYLTIELKGSIPRPMRPLIGNRVFGCDDCLAVCPWNKFAVDANASYRAEPVRDPPDLADLSQLDDTAFRSRFAGSPVKRLGRARFLRNVAVALGNARDPMLIGAVRLLAEDSEPLVREHAVWALSRLLGSGDLRRLRKPDPDPAVNAEWEHVLNSGGSFTAQL